MNKITWMLALFLVGLGTAPAVLVDFSFSYDRVELKNGKKLQRVVFSTYDTRTGRVSAVVGKRKAMTLRLADLPDEIAARIKERAPAQTEAEIAEEKQQAAVDLEDAKQRAKELEQRAVSATKDDRDAQRSLDVKRAEAQIEQDSKTEATVAAAAQEMATHYFTYEADPHSSKGYVFGSNVLLEDPEPVPGWTGRWRVRGKVGVQYLTNNIGAVGRSTKDFEMLIDVPLKGKPKLVDVTINRM